MIPRELAKKIRYIEIYTSKAVNDVLAGEYQSVFKGQGMEFEEVLTFGILLNVTAGLGAVAFAWVDDWLGSKPTILIAVACLTVFGGAILVVEGKLWFYVLGCVIGIFIGPAQAASRTMMARLAPPDMRTEMFGLYAFSGKARTFLGLLAVGLLTAASRSMRIGMMTILVLLLIGLLIVLRVREPAL